MSPRLLFTIDDAQRAGDEWGFNCGPAAICAVLGKTPDEVRPHLGDFERPNKRFTNPTLMDDTLFRLGVKVYGRTVRHVAMRAAEAEIRTAPILSWPRLGLVRIQWEGPWTEPGVPIAARYRHTHWLGARIIDPAYQWERSRNGSTPVEIFDVNCMSVGGWVSLDTWSAQVVPWLLKEVEPKAWGTWHQTHVLELTP